VREEAATVLNRPIDVFYEEHDAGDADIALQFAILARLSTASARTGLSTLQARFDSH
jgi:hypothetical protein